jgi:hypothetical protein
MKDKGVHARDMGDDRVRARDMRDDRVYARDMGDKRVRARGGRMQMPRSRGAASGFLLVLLGAWGALIPFVGPYFDWAFTPDQEWVWTTGRGWLEVLPGAVTALGGLLLLSSRNRFTAMLGGWLTVLAGGWFVVGRALAGLLAIGDAGTPVAATDAKRVALDLTYFYGLGALIIFLGAIALGRLSIRSARDIRYAHRTAMDSVATAEPPASDDVTEIQPVEATPQPRHRPWGNVFGRGSRLAHR